MCADDESIFDETSNHETKAKTKRTDENVTIDGRRKKFWNHVTDEHELQRRRGLTVVQVLEEFPVCPMGYALEKIPGGYHCEGKIHYLSDEDVEDFRNGKQLDEGDWRAAEIKLTGTDPFPHLPVDWRPEPWPFSIGSPQDLTGGATRNLGTLGSTRRGRDQTPTGERSRSIRTDSGGKHQTRLILSGVLDYQMRRCWTNCCCVRHVDGGAAHGSASLIRVTGVPLISSNGSKLRLSSIFARHSSASPASRLLLRAQ